MLVTLRKSLFDPRLLWLRYIVALTLIIGLIVVTHQLQSTKLQTASRFAELINTSGQQRMLSQRILFLAGLVLHDRNLEYSEALDTTITTFENNHKWLLRNGLEDEQIKAFYFAMDGANLDREVSTYVEEGRAFLAAVELGADEQAAQFYKTLMSSGMNELLSDLLSIVAIYERKATENALGLVHLQSLALFSAISLLLFEALFIFYPAQKSVSRALDKAEQTATSLSKVNQKLQAAAYLDDMTGISNRRGFFKQMNEAIGPNLHAGRTAILYLIDLDGFKQINDTKGHKAGDMVLAACARALNEELAPNDFLARMGGDEFSVLHFSEEYSESSALTFAERLIQSIAALEVAADANHKLGASIGIRCYDGQNGDLERLLEDADHALYEAKRTGKNRSAFYTPESSNGLTKPENLERAATSIRSGANVAALNLKAR